VSPNRASALLGTLQFVVGAIAGTLVGALHNGTALPMAGVIAGCGVAALLAFPTLADQRVPRATATEVEKAERKKFAIVRSA